MESYGQRLSTANEMYLRYLKVYQDFCESINSSELSRFGIKTTNDMLTFGQQVGFEYLQYSFAFRFQYMLHERHKGKLLFYSIYLDGGAKFDERTPLVVYFDEQGNAYSSSRDEFSIQNLLKEDERQEFILKCIAAAAGLD